MKNKRIVIDLDSCVECIYNYTNICKADNEYRSVNIEIPDWCPLDDIQETEPEEREKGEVFCGTCKHLNMLSCRAEHKLVKEPHGISKIYPYMYDKNEYNDCTDYEYDISWFEIIKNKIVNWLNTKVEMME